MLNSQDYMKMLYELVRDSPLARDDVHQRVIEDIRAGEYPLAFSLLCDWIYEDEVTIDAEYYQRLLNASEELGSEDLVSAIGEELVRE